MIAACIKNKRPFNAIAEGKGGCAIAPPLIENAWIVPISLIQLFCVVQSDFVSQPYRIFAPK